MQQSKYPMKEILDECIKLSRQAGEAIMLVYNSDDFEKQADVQIKDDDSPLTKADLMAHNIIVTGLEKRFPEIPCLSEESKNITFTQRKKWRQCLIIDPLDGTKEFIARNGEFTVNIALVVEGKAVLGVIYAPVLDRLYYAAVAIGAFKQETNSTAKPISVKSLKKHGKQHLTVVTSRRTEVDEIEQLCRNFASYDLTTCGSSLKMCQVAEGVADLSPGLVTTSEWDTAAAQAIVEQAGGKIVQLDFSEMRYNKKCLLNPFFFVFGDPSFNWKEKLSASEHNDLD